VADEGPVPVFADAPPHDQAPPAQQRTNPIDFTSPLCASDLAQILRDMGFSAANNNAVEVRLRRYREKYPDCCVEQDDDSRRHNKPKYYYWPEKVLDGLIKHFESRPTTADRRRMTDDG
jgi:hypothetical protein